ncbi:MAG: hypothetical protein ACREV5_07385 [Steroidobacter sp.]
MQDIPFQCTSVGKTHGRKRHASALLPLALLVVSVQVAAQEETAAVLKLQEVDFFYRSSSVRFPCHELQNNVATLFRAVGARDDVEVTVSGCNAMVALDEPAETWRTPTNRGHISGPWQTSSDRFGAPPTGRDQSAHVRVRLMMPVKVTPEILEEMNKDKARRELVSRVTGNPGANLHDPIVFPAQRQLITLSHRTIKLEPEHCELLEQMTRSAFRKLDVRVVGGGPKCDRDRVSHIPPQVTVEALMPVMPRTPQIAPAAGESEPEPETPATSESEPPQTATETAPD